MLLELTMLSPGRIGSNTNIARLINASGRYELRKIIFGLVAGKPVVNPLGRLVVERRNKCRVPLRREGKEEENLINTTARAQDRPLKNVPNLLNSDLKP